MLVATRFYEQGKLSLGRAAEMAGLPKSTFAELSGKYNVSIFNYPASDLFFLLSVLFVLKAEIL